MANGFRTIPSAIAQQAALAQLREIQNPNLALEREIQKAVELQQIQQQSPENQLALQIKQAQLAQIPLESERQNLVVQELRRQLDPAYQASEDARKLAFDVNRATQIANATSKGEKGFFDANSGRWIENVGGRLVATQIPLAESLGTTGALPSVSASDIPSVDPTLFSGTTVIPTSPTPSRTTLAGTIEQRAKAAEDQKNEDRDFRRQLQEDAQTFRSEESKLNREFLQGKDSSKTAGTYSKQQLSSVNSLTDRFQRNDYVKKASSAQNAIDIILQGLSQNNSTGDIAAINQFQAGMVDPGATVREGDVKLITNSAPLLSRVQNYIPRLLKGSVLPPEMRNEMRKISIDIYNMRAKNANDIAVKRFKNNAKNAGIEFEDIGQEFNQLSPEGTVITSPVSTPGFNPNAPNPVSSGNTFEILP